jgi:hypothetical protein
MSKRKSNGTGIVIDKNIPMPTSTHKKYPLDDMAVGDSFFVADPTKRAGLYTSAARYDIKVSVRLEGTGFRVWRTA